MVLYYIWWVSVGIVEAVVSDPNASIKEKVEGIK